MKYDPKDWLAGFISPLNDKQHAQLGRIAVLWGQIEFFIDAILPKISQLSKDELEALGVTRKGMGQKVAFLKATTKRKAEEPTKSIVFEFVEIIENTKVDRNHAFHGAWGWRWDNRKQTCDVRARYDQEPGKPFKPEKLAWLEEQLCRCSNLGSKAFSLVFEEPEPETDFISRFFHGQRGNPQWLEQWHTQNPLNPRDLDYGENRVQLPRPRDPKG